MARGLEAPDSWESLYLARGEEVSPQRPVFTGDVYQDTAGHGSDVGAQPSMFVVVQHPCALRTNGVSLVPRILVAEVQPRDPLAPSAWDGSYRIMPLPSLRPQDGGGGHYCAVLPQLFVVTPDHLAACERIACLSDVGVNLLLQRWVHHNSRVVVETHRFTEVTAGPLAEAEILEDWVTAREGQGMDRPRAEQECHAFLRAVPEGGSTSRQQALEDPQRRSEVRRAVRAQLKAAPSPA